MNVRKIKQEFPDGSKWQELANFVARKKREISIIKDAKADPQLRKIQKKRDEFLSKPSPKKD